MIEYRNNPEMLGDFEAVISLIDAYNLLQSDRINDKEQLVDAILCLYGMDFDSEQAELLKDSRMLANIPLDGKVEYLVKTLQEGDVDILRQNIEKDIHKISMTPNMSDENFVGNSSGVAIKYKLLAFEQNIKNKERYMEKGLMERFKLYNSFLMSKSQMQEVPIEEVDAIFKRNLPSNDYEISQMINNLSDLVDSETLLAQLSFIKDAKEIYGDELSNVYGYYRAVINESYNKTIYDTQIGTGYDFSFNKLDDKTINAVLNAKWHGGNYSTRIWGNTNILADRLSETLGGALISGQDMSKTISEVQKAFDVGKYYAERLVRTETNHFNAEAEALAYKELGVEKYVFVATLDNRTSKICQSLDNKVFIFDKRKTGVNFPPMHPNCRSTYYAYIDEGVEINLMRRARNPITGETEIIENMSYEEWKRHINGRYGDNALEISAKKQANLKRDTEQYDRYKSVLGSQNMPENIEKWQDIKYNNDKGYIQIKYDYTLKQHYNKVIEKGELSPLVNFDTYKKIDDMAKNELVGLTTTNGIKIKSYSKHFVDRICGSIEQRRSGVEISNIKDIISNSNEIKHLEKSDVIIGNDIQVSINPTTGNLIQTNPRVRRNKNDKN